MTEHWSVLGEFVAREWNKKKKVKELNLASKIRIFSPS